MVAGGQGPNPRGELQQLLFVLFSKFSMGTGGTAPPEEATNKSPYHQLVRACWLFRRLTRRPFNQKIAVKCCPLPGCVSKSLIYQKKKAYLRSNPVEKPGNETETDIICRSSAAASNLLLHVRHPLRVVFTAYYGVITYCIVLHVKPKLAV